MKKPHSRNQDQWNERLDKNLEEEQEGDVSADINARNFHESANKYERAHQDDEAFDQDNTAKDKKMTYDDPIDTDNPSHHLDREE